MRTILLLAVLTGTANADIITLSAWQQVGEIDWQGYGLRGELIYEPSTGIINAGKLSSQHPIAWESWTMWVSGSRTSCGFRDVLQHELSQWRLDRRHAGPSCPCF